MNIAIFGAPGSGKGTQSERLIDRYGLHHISTGEVLRDHIKRGTELGKIADSYIPMNSWLRCLQIFSSRILRQQPKA